MNAVTLPIALLLFLPAPSSYVTAKADAMPKGGGCVAPVALVSTALGDTVRACPGDTILLDGSGSTAAAGHWVHYWVWNFGNGTMDTTSTPVVAFQVGDGGYSMVYLQVIDDAGCSSDSTASLPIFVSQEPSFTGILVPDTICPQMDLMLQGNAVQPSLVPSHMFIGDPMPDLPDAPAGSVSFPITVSGADPGAIITDSEDLGDICISMEHSFMGDFILTLTCPNGSSATLHQQGGFDTYLGFPVDLDDFNPVHGTCLTYCFNSHPDFGTWEECSADGITPNVIEWGNHATLAPASYTPVDSLSDLVGCPVNGEWTLSFVDLWGSDNGFLCSWSIGLAGDTTVAINAQGPILGLSSPDSSFWSGPNVTNDSVVPGLALFTPSAEDVQAFTYSVIDSYGCMYDTTLSVLVRSIDPPVINPGVGEGELCAYNDFGAVYTWYLNGISSGYTGMCWTPTGPGLVAVVGMDQDGCTASTDFLPTTIDLPAVNALAIVPDHGLAIALQTPNDLPVLLRLMDLAGRVLAKQQAQPTGGRAEARMATQLAAGCYIMQAVQAGSSVSRRIVVP